MRLPCADARRPAAADGAGHTRRARSTKQSDEDEGDGGSDSGRYGQDAEEGEEEGEEGEEGEEEVDGEEDGEEDEEDEAEDEDEDEYEADAQEEGAGAEHAHAGGSNLGALDALLQAAAGAGPVRALPHSGHGWAHGENGGGWHGQGNGVDGHGGGDGGGEMSQAEKVLMAAKEKPKKKDNKTWPAASRPVARHEHEAMSADTRAWVQKMLKMHGYSEQQAQKKNLEKRTL